MQLSPADYALWGAGTVLEVLLCGLVLRYRAYRQIPFFSAYLFLTTARTLSLWWIYHDPNLEAGIVFNAYWVTQLLQVAARGLAAAEICWLTLGAHRGVWALAWRLLAGVGAALIIVAAASAFENTNWVGAFIYRGERGLELAITSLLVALFSVCRYYRVRVEPVVKYLALGLGLYAVIQAINNSFVYAWFASFLPWWNQVRTLSFDVALLIWCWGLRKPVELPAATPAMLEPEVYEQLTPQVSYRLRELNARLVEMLK